ncbi:hypothetical protein ALO62_200082 [Pseudomonas amygdali pv. myricae]|nr:hypothetical protein ALO62_200082 [Pseudomonas amygdali pv. myricae]
MIINGTWRKVGIIMILMKTQQRIIWISSMLIINFLDGIERLTGTGQTSTKK